MNLKSYMQEVYNYPRLTIEEEVELFKRAKKQPELKENIIKSFLYLVVDIVKKYKNFHYIREDMVQEGNLGLIKAVDKYNVEIGICFSLYASWWIISQIKKLISRQIHMIKLPKYITDAMEYLLRYDINYQQYSLAELEKLTYIKSSVLEKAIYCLEHPAITVPHSNHDLIDNRNHANQRLEKKQKEYIVTKKLSILRPKEKIIVKMYFGIKPYKKRTLFEIAKIFSITDVRIFQIKERALEKIKREEL